MALFAELRRRNVLKVALLYAVACWLVVWFVDIVQAEVDALKRLHAQLQDDRPSRFFRENRRPEPARPKRKRGGGQQARQASEGSPES